MKLIQLIQEIGDASSKPFKWRKWSENEYYSKYVFRADSDISYSVTIENDNTTYGGKAIVVEFSADHDKLSQLNKDKSEKFMTNKGEQYRILNTVMEIVKDAIKSRNKGLFKKPVKYLVFTPMVRSGKDDWLDPMKNARTKLYLAFVKQAFPNSTVEDRNGMVVVTLGK